MNSAVVWPGPCSGLPPPLPQTLSLHPTDIPPSVLQNKCMEEVGPEAVLDLRIKDHSFTDKRGAGETRPNQLEPGPVG